MKYLLPGLKSIDQTYFNGVLLVGQFENTVAVGTCNNFRPFVSRLVDMARICPSWLKHTLSAEVVKFIIDLRGVRSVMVAVRAILLRDVIDEYDCLSL